MQTKQDEQVIYLKDLIFSALYRWKRILVWGLLLAVLLGGFKGVSAWQDANTSKDTLQQTLAWKSYEAEKKALETQLTALQQNIERQNTYLQESVLMQLDPYAFYEATLSVYVDTGYQILPDMVYQSPDLTGAILNSYITVLTGEASIRSIADRLNMDTVYLLELITAATIEGTNTLLIQARYPDQKGAQQLLDLLAEQLTLIQPDIAQTVQTHEIRTVQQYVRKTADAELQALQAQEEQSLMELYDSIDTAEAALQALVPPQAASMGSVVRSAVLFAVIGGILGVFLAVLCVWISHICSGRVYSARTLYNRTGVKVLGCVNSEAQQNAVTAKLRALEGRNSADRSSQSQLLAANVRNLCGEAKHLLVTGSTHADFLTEALLQAMPGTQVTCCGSLLTDISAVEALAVCDYVLLVEQCAVSRYADVSQALSLIRDNGKNALGCVLLDG